MQGDAARCPVCGRQPEPDSRGRLVACCSRTVRQPRAHMPARAALASWSRLVEATLLRAGGAVAFLTGDGTRGGALAVLLLLALLAAGCFGLRGCV